MRRTASEVLRELQIRVARLERLSREQALKSIEVVIRETPPVLKIKRVKYPQTRQEFLEIERGKVPVIFYDCPLSSSVESRSDLLKSGFNPFVEARLGDRKSEDITDLLKIRFQDLLRSDFEMKSRYIGKHRLSTQELRKLLGINLYGKGQILEGRGSNSANMWCGPKGCVTPLHLDTINNLAWNVYGRKTWLLASPSDMYNKGYLDPNFREPYTQNDKGVWVRNDKIRDPSFSKMTEDPLTTLNKYPKAKGIRFHEVVMGENEILYLPAYWGHYVRTDSDSLMINHWYDQVPKVLNPL